MNATMNTNNTNTNTAAELHAEAVKKNVKPVAKSTLKAVEKIHGIINTAEAKMNDINNAAEAIKTMNAAAAEISAEKIVRPHKLNDVKAVAADIVAIKTAAKKAFDPLLSYEAEYAAAKGAERSNIGRKISAAAEAVNAAAKIAAEKLEACNEAYNLITMPKTHTEKVQELSEEIAEKVKGVKASEFFAEYAKVKFAIFPKKADFVAALGELEGKGAYINMNIAAEKLLVCAITHRANMEAAAISKNEKDIKAMEVSSNETFNALKDICAIFGLKNGVNIGYNSATVGAIAAKSYRFVPKDEIKEGYSATEKSAMAFMKEVFKELMASDSITNAAEAARKKAAERQAKREARAAKKAKKA